MSRITSYSVGLLLAIILTLAAFSLGFMHIGTLPNLIPAMFIIPAVLALAMIQLAAQLVFFLHLGRGKDSQWNTALFCFTFFGILVIITASIWIMYHLNYNMSPSQVDQYLRDQSSF